MLQRLWHFCRKPNNITNDISIHPSYPKIDTIHSLSVVLHPDDAVDIVMMHPDLELLSVSDIANEAEKFSELLVYVTNPLMEPKLLATIANKAKNSTSIKEQLFYDNVITYYRIIRAEYEKKLIDKGPVIRPRLAFNLR